MPTKKPESVEKEKTTRKRRDHGDGSIYQRSDKRWVASLSLPSGKRTSLYGKSKQEVKEKLKKALAQLEHGTFVTAPHESVETHMRHWLQVKKIQLKTGTYCSYQNRMEKHILPAIGHIPLQKLRSQVIQELYLDLQKAGLSPNTVRTIHIILKGAFTAAVTWKKISTNPCNDVVPPRAQKKERAFLTQEQAQHLLTLAQGRRIACLLTLALTTGMRRGELLALRWSDIDFEKATLQVSRSLSYYNPEKTGYIYEEAEPKTASSRRLIPLPQVTAQALQKHRLQQVEVRLQASVWEEKGLVFPNPRGGYYCFITLQQELKKLLHEAGLPSLRFHDLRHSAATILLAMGISPKLIQERLGHSDITITLGLYGHVTGSMQDQAMQALDAHFSRSISSM